MALIKLCFAFFIFCLGCGAVGSFFIFLFDVVKWHLAEKRTIISASAQKLPNLFKGGESNGNNNDDTGNNGTSDGNGNSSGDSNGSCNGDSGSSAEPRTDDRQRTSQAIFDSWLQSGSRSSE